MSNSDRLASQAIRTSIENKISVVYESILIQKIVAIFSKIEQQILKNIDTYYNENILYNANLDLILAPIHESHKEYYEIIEYYSLKEFERSRKEGRRITELTVQLQNKKEDESAAMKSTRSTIDFDNDADDYFDTLPAARADLSARTYKFSEKTLARVDDDIYEVLTNGYLKGEGINKVKKEIKDRFNSLKTWEAQRIARTEIHVSHNMGMMQGYSDLNVDYIMWNAHLDTRTRRSHMRLDGEIIRVGELFSNNMGYPGDLNGDASEIINCRCVASPFIIPYGYSAPPFSPFRESDLIKINTNQTDNELEIKPVESKPKQDTKPVLTNEELNKLSFKELAKHNGVEYNGVQVYDYDKRKYHVFTEKFDDGRKLVLRFEDTAVKSYNRKGVATANEIIHEVYKVPRVLRNETREVWFKDTNQGIRIRPTKTGYDSLGNNVGGYNTYLYKTKRDIEKYDDYNHTIVINPKFFKGAKGKLSYLWEQDDRAITKWKHTLHHEFEHSSDLTQKDFKNNIVQVRRRNSYDDEYLQIHRKEKYFTDYSNTAIEEAYAEHGGYISYMESNPSEQNKLITINVIEKGKYIDKDITYDEYKKLYPKHYNYFKQLHKRSKL